MRRLPSRLPALLAVLFTGLLAALTQPARASLLIQVDKSAQQMTVIVDGDPRYVWPVSTGRDSYDTPAGQYKPFRMEKDHFSREWDDAPMPYSIFFTQQGHAIHGTNHKITGTPESHGCVRLSVAHAGVLWDLVKQQGMANVRVELDGRIPTRNELVARRETGSALTDRDYRNDPIYRDNERAYTDRTYNGRGDERRYDGRIANDEPEFTGDVPQRSAQAGGWREYREGGRVYYYRDGPDEERRLPPRRRPHYYRGFGGNPFW
jgi:L,D-transpeptidase-like protein